MIFSKFKFSFYPALLILLCSSAAQLSLADSAADTSTPSRVQSRQCSYAGIARNKITCATYITAKESGSFQLPVAIVHATPGKRASEAVVLIPGGPGEGYQLAERSLEYWLEWMRQTKISRDLVLFDPRGTGESLPSRNCEEYDTKSIEWVAQNLDIEKELKISHPVLKNCLYEYDRWLKQNVDVSIQPHPGLGLMSSVYQAADVNGLLGALDYEAWHLWGVSYGTRVALLAANHDKVKTVLLDSPYPLNKGRLSEWPALLDGALKKHQEIYRVLYSGKGKYPDFDTLWKKVIYRLDQSPAVFKIQRWDSEEREPLTLVLNSDRMISLAYYVLYDTSLWLPFYEGLEFLQSDSTPPDIIQETLQKVASAFKVSAEETEKADSLTLVLESFATSSFDPLFNSMVYFAVECIDNVIDEESSYKAELKKYPHLSRYLGHEWHYDICRDPVFDKRNPVSRQLLPIDKPTLILSGEYDPVTPKEWGIELQRQLGDKARLRVVGGAGHAVTVGDNCTPDLFELFINGSPFDPAAICKDIELAWP